MKSNLHSELVPVSRALAAWRRARPHRQPIPEALWKRMGALARVHGVSAVSQALRLDYYSLKAWAGRQRRSASDFVEVKLAPSGGAPPGCTAEFENSQGRKLVLRWSGTPGPELAVLVQAFLNQGA